MTSHGWKRRALVFLLIVPGCFLNQPAPVVTIPLQPPQAVTETAVSTRSGRGTAGAKRMSGLWRHRKAPRGDPASDGL
jgi:hypothetical protein